MESKISLLEQILRDVANDISNGVNTEVEDSFAIATQRRLGFEREQGWILFCHCMDLIGDCEMAITSFKRHALGGLDFGAQLLRLCGFLTCAYQQGWAIIQLFEIFKAPMKTKVKAAFHELELIQLRNVAAAHTVTFNDHASGKSTSFTVSRPHLQVGELWVLDENNNIRKWDLESAVKSYIEWAESTLIIVCQKCISSTFRTSPPEREKFNNRLTAILSNTASKSR